MDNETKFNPAFIARERAIVPDDLPWNYKPVEYDDPSREYGGEPEPVVGAWITPFTIDLGEYMGLTTDAAVFICSAANNYPAALDEIERLRDENASLRNEVDLFRDTLADDEMYCMELKGQIAALTAERDALREAGTFALSKMVEQHRSDAMTSAIEKTGNSDNWRDFLPAECKMLFAALDNQSK